MHNFYKFFLDENLESNCFFSNLKSKKFEFCLYFLIPNFDQKRIKSYFVKNFPKKKFRYFLKIFAYLKILSSGVLSVKNEVASGLNQISLEQRKISNLYINLNYFFNPMFFLT